MRLHSEFSIVDGTNRIESVIQAAAADGQPALAITDLNNLFGAIKFYKEGRAKGVKPILGAEVVVEGLRADPAVTQRLVLLVQNHAGYLNLCQLLALGWTTNVVREQSVPKWAWLEQHNEGLMVLSGAHAGSLGQALLQDDVSRAREIALKMAGAFAHRFYIELQRAGRADDEPHVQAAVQLAARLNLPVVATHPVQFTTPEEDRKSTRLNSSHIPLSRMPSSA